MNDSTTPQDGKAMSPASAGSHGPVAWWFKCDDYESATLLKEHADAMAAPYGTTPIPLYRSPALTDEEREAIQRIVDYSSLREKDLAALQSLLRRLA